jgi:putative hydrolase of the HAD superfamily
VIKAIVFDLDDTLIDRNQTMANALHDQYIRFAKELFPLSRDRFIESNLRYQRFGYVSAFEAYKNVVAEDDILGISPEDLYSDLLTRYGDQPVLCEGVISVLEPLFPIYKLAIITNGIDVWQKKKLSQSGIQKYFQTVIISENVGIKKPDAKIFLVCLGELGVSPEEMVYIGDNPVLDIQAARNCGIHAIYLRTDHFETMENIGISIDRIQDIPAAIEELMC